MTNNVYFALLLIYYCKNVPTSMLKNETKGKKKAKNKIKKNEKNYNYKKNKKNKNIIKKIQQIRDRPKKGVGGRGGGAHRKIFVQSFCLNHSVFSS